MLVLFALIGLSVWSKLIIVVDDKKITTSVLCAQSSGATRGGGAARVKGYTLSEKILFLKFK